MIKSVLTNHKFAWIDILNPSREELQKVALDYGLHGTSIEDCLDPIHQPKYEQIKDTVFIILRVYDKDCNPRTNSVHNLTRKIAVFLGPGFIITVHRLEIDFFSVFMDKWQAKQEQDTSEPYLILFDLIKEAVFSFAPALEQLEVSLEEFEESIFSNEDIPVIIKEIHWFRARVSSIRHVFRQTLDAMIKFSDYSDAYLPVHQDIRERLERYLSVTNSLREASNDILNTQISLASHRTNEVIRLLTIFSVFFLPLTFIVGVYGMNFAYMPELRWFLGYPLIWLVMIGITGGIYLWFKKRGWLK